MNARLKTWLLAAGLAPAVALAKPAPPPAPASAPEAEAPPSAPATEPPPSTTRCRQETDATVRKLDGVAHPADIWTTEVALTRRLSRADCVAALPGTLAAPAPAAIPSRINTEYEPLRQPTGPGVGPWILGGASVALLGAVLYVDHSANDARSAVERAQSRDDARGFKKATVDFENQQTLARGLLAGCVAAGIGGVVWALLGGDADPIQSRPVFHDAREIR